MCFFLRKLYQMMIGNDHPHLCVHLQFFSPFFFLSLITERLMTGAFLKSKCIKTQAHKKGTYTYFHVSTHLPLSWAYLAVDPELPGGQFKRSAQQTLEKNAPFLSLERRQQQLLTWPYLSQMLQGTGYCINSTPRFSHFSPRTLVLSWPTSLSLSISTPRAPGSPQECG